MRKLSTYESEIEYLVRRRFPLSPHFNALRYSGSAGDFELEREAVSQYRAELKGTAPAEFERILAAENEREREEVAARLRREEEQRFFNQPRADATYDHYCKTAYWTLDEAVALSLGKNPDIVHWKSVSPLVELSPFARAYSKRRDLTLRAKWAQQLFDPVYPSIFMSWAARTGIALPPDLTSKALASGISLKGWQDLYEDCLAKRKADMAELTERRKKDMETLAHYRGQIQKLEAKLAEATDRHDVSAAGSPMATQERENLQLLAFLGAVRAYGYDPDSRTSAARDMEADTDKLGLRFTDDRIRHHLKKAHEIVPRDWRPRLGLKPNSDKT